MYKIIQVDINMKYEIWVYNTKHEKNQIYE